ncbi:hypothetical protein F53441_2348 [Fusarium austroafricanum]|uniref:Uncharacterized protein n=1 Tax=Fusarium austroafricanum TaxID=2364996 RepID=A0A8H4KTE2_9HYPO|nr:hypothetical protein F53441_2348 [Fusarium austroafricanum]
MNESTETVPLYAYDYLVLHGASHLVASDSVFQQLKTRIVDIRSLQDTQAIPVADVEPTREGSWYPDLVNTDRAEPLWLFQYPTKEQLAFCQWEFTSRTQRGHLILTEVLKSPPTVVVTGAVYKVLRTLTIGILLSPEQPNVGTIYGVPEDESYHCMSLSLQTLQDNLSPRYTIAHVEKNGINVIIGVIDGLTVLLRAVCLLANIERKPPYVKILKHARGDLTTTARYVVLRCAKMLGVLHHQDPDASFDLTAASLTSLEARRGGKLPVPRSPPASNKEPLSFESAIDHVSVIADLLEIPDVKAISWGHWLEIISAAIWGKLDSVL